MSLLNIEQHFLGPNPYSSDPVIKVVWSDDFLSQSDLVRGVQPMAEMSSRWIKPLEIPHHDPQDKKMAMATWLTHWSFCLLNAERGHLKAFGSRWEDDRLASWVGYHDARLSFAALGFAAQSLQAFSQGQKQQAAFEKETETFLKHCRVKHPDFQAKYIMEAADALGVPYFQITDLTKTWQYGWGCQSIVSIETGIAENSYLFQRVAGNKPLAKDMLRSLGLPVGREHVVETSEELPAALKAVGFPCVTKPVNGQQSKNVTVDIRSEDALLEGFNLAHEYNGGPVIVEEMRFGDVYRLMAFHGAFHSSIRRTPARVTGDGVSTIKELLDQKETARLADPMASKFIGPVPIDKELHTTLADAGYTLKSIPPKGQVLPVRKLPRSTRGGTFTDDTAITHPHVKQMVMSIAQAMRMPSVGIDYITQDISKPPTATCGFLEVNSIPSLAIPLAAGVSLETCVRGFFGGHVGRIPSTLHIYRSYETIPTKVDLNRDSGNGWVHGLRCGLGTLQLTVPETTTFECARTLLRNPLTQRIDIAMTLDDVMRQGLPIDHFDHISLSDMDLGIPAEWQRVLEEASNMEITNSP